MGSVRVVLSVEITGMRLGWAPSGVDGEDTWGNFLLGLRWMLIGLHLIRLLLHAFFGCTD